MNAAWRWCRHEVAAELRCAATLELGVGGPGRGLGERVAGPVAPDSGATARRRDPPSAGAPPGGRVLQHQQQATLTALVGRNRTPSGWRVVPIRSGSIPAPADGDIQDRLGGQSEDGRGADVLYDNHELSEGGPQLDRQPLERPGSTGIA
jgi:hypothetical protein